MRIGLLSLAVVLAGSPLLAGCPDPACEEGACDVARPPGECTDGEAALLGDVECTPVGWSPCPDGWVAERGACAPTGGRAAGEIPCADGFAAADVGCDAIIAGAPCAGAARPAIGEAECVDVGDCAAPPPSDASLFVDDTFADAELDATHVRTIGEALATASAGDVVFVEAGSYAEEVVPPAGVILVGRCAEQVIIQGPGSPGLGFSGDQGIVVRGFTVRGFELGMQAEFGATATLEDVIFEDNVTSGAFVLDPGTDVTLRRSLVRDSQPDGSNRFGQGIAVGFGAQLTLEDSAVVNNRDQGVFVNGADSTAFIRRSVIGWTQARADGSLGWGTSAQSGGSYTLEDSVIVGNTGVGVHGAGEDVTLTVRGSVVVDTVAATGLLVAQSQGIGISSQSGARLTIEDSTVRDSTTFGVRVGQNALPTLASGLVVDGVLPAAGDFLSIAVVAQSESDLSLVDSLVRNPAGSDGRNDLGLGVVAQGGAALTITRSTIERVASAGVAADGPGTTLVLSDVLVRDMSTADADFGYGVSVSRDAVATGDGIGLIGAQSSALFVDDAEVSVVRATIVDSTVSSRGRGRGISAQFGATVSVQAARLSRNTQVGVFAFGDGTTLALTDVVVEDTAADLTGEYGHGVESVEGAVVVLDRVIVQRNDGVGVISAAGAGSLSLTRVLDNSVGVHGQDGVSIVDVASLPSGGPDELEILVEQTTEFVDNDTRVGGGTLPLPEATGSPTSE